MSSPNPEIAQLQAAIAALEAQRAILGDAVVETMLAPAREKLAALQAAEQPAQQRKLATVLFADVSGFTALSETMDAEVVAGIMNDLWAEVDRAILDHGGRIDKHIGDAVMALWGAEAAREDDPEMAVRAALDMQAAVGRFCATHDVPLSMRVGLNTGPVVLGAVATTHEFTAMGDAVNLASRLEHAAPVDGILISHDTYRQIRGIFDVLEQAPLAVKGKAEPVQTYIVQRAKPRAFRMATRGVEGVETRMVGRDSELNLLREAFIDAMEGRETRVVTIVGEAGVGKSRLLYEFDNWIELRPEPIFYFKGRSTPNLQNVPFSLFRDLFAYRFDILDSDPAAMALDKFRRGMAGALEPDKADVVGHWLGFDFSASEAVQRLLGGDFGATARVHLTRYFRTLAAAEPVVVFLEDIHWADDSSLDLAAYLPRAIPEAQLLCVAVTRPSLFERRPGWGEGEAAFKRVSLTMLSKRASRALVDEILQRVDEVPDSLRELITDAAEGNPFYVEEMVKMLIDQGVIVRGPANDDGRRTTDDTASAPRPQATDPSPLTTDPRPLAVHGATTERWTVRPDKLAGLKVPPTLHGLLQARLDGLPRAEREALQRAAVVGRLFWDDAVADLLQAEREIVRDTLTSVRGRELIFRRERSSFDAAEEYIFKHALLRDVAYETVLLKYRAEFHGKVARWLEAHAGDRRDEVLGLIAEHYIQAGERLRAAELLERSAAEAHAVGASAAVRASLERALALREAAGQVEGPEVTAACLLLGRALVVLGDLPVAEAALERALAGSRREGDREAEALARVQLAIAAFRTGDYDRATALAGEGVALARESAGPALADVVRVAAMVAWITGDLDAAREQALEARALALRSGNTRVARAALNTLGAVATDRHELERARDYFQTYLAEARVTGDAYAETIALANLGSNAYQRGDYASARLSAQLAVERFRELGTQAALISSAGNLAQADLQLGNVAAARQGVREVLSLARSLGMAPHVLGGLIVTAQILLAEGQSERALTLYGLALAHPALDAQSRLEIDDELARLDLPPEQLEAGLAAGAALDFEAVVQEILDGEW
jgi:class 3 adenylate cyclase/tetratricopeptide (TPR) repeat protein